jgi:heme-degrading monooxygenase HmoA
VTATWVINCFEVPAERDGEFLRLLGEVNAYRRTRPGFVSSRLHRARRPEARFRFVNVAEWESADRLLAARDETYRRLAANVAEAGFVASPEMYDVVQEAHAGERAQEHPTGECAGPGVG